MRASSWSALLLAWAAGCSGEASPGSVGDAPAGAGVEAASDEDGGGPPGSRLATHWVLSSSLVNARDLGGVPIGEEGRTRYGELFRGPPLALDGPGCGSFRELGVRTVIDLRMPDEREATPDAACALEGVEVVLAPLPTPYNVSAADYIADLDAAESMASALAALTDPEAYPIYFHCTWGRDRTGILSALVLRALGVARELVLEEYLLSAELVGAYPRSLEAALDELERRGGVEAYLASLGVSAGELRALRSRLVR